MTTRPWSIDERLADIVCQHRRLPSSMRRAGLRTAAFVGLLHGALLVPIVAAQNPVYPAGPPFRPVPGPEISLRNLRGELQNKTTGTFTVTSGPGTGRNGGPAG